MDFQQYYDKYGIELTLPQRQGAQPVILTCADIFEAWDCYTLLKSIDGVRSLESKDLQKGKYGLGLLYMERMARVLRSYKLSARRRRSRQLAVSRLLLPVVDYSLMPTAACWRGKKLEHLGRGERAALVRDYEALSRNIEAILRMLRDFVKDTYQTDETDSRRE